MRVVPQSSETIYAPPKTPLGALVFAVASVAAVTVVSTLVFLNELPSYGLPKSEIDQITFVSWTVSAVAGTLLSLAFVAAYAVFHKLEARVHAAEQQGRGRQAVAAYVLTVDREGHVLYINKTAPGLDRASVIGKPIYNFMAEAKQGAPRRALQQVFEEQRASAYSNEAVGPHGNTVLYKVDVEPVVHEGRVVAALMIAEQVGE